MSQSSLFYDNTVAYTDGDYDRLGTMKKASDLVFAYFTWVLEDHRRTMIDAEHKSKIEELIAQCSQVFGTTTLREPLVRYFVANTLLSAQQAERESLKDEAWLPFNQSAFVEMFEPEMVQLCMEDLSVHNQLMYAGRFLAECSDFSADQDEVQKATLIGSDLNFVLTVSWDMLLQMGGIEDDGSFVCVGKALMKTLHGFYEQPKEDPSEGA